MTVTRKTNEALEANIRDVLGRMATINANRIGITSDNGLIFLNGHVRGVTWRESIVQAALQVDGVQAVVDELKVRTSHSCFQNVELASQATGVLKELTALTGGRMKVVVRDGKVWLSGSGLGASEKQTILAAFRDVLDAKGLHMDVEVSTSLQDDSITADPTPGRSLRPA
jgi:osmotically-inducible protein OsmY